MKRFLALILVAYACGPMASATPVILDTDIGDDIDDTWALCMLLGSPQLDLKLIVTDYTNTDTRTRLVAKILDRLGRRDVPIGTGVTRGTDAIAQSKWLGDFDLKTYKGTVHTDGVAAMIDFLMASKEKVTLIVLGPQTNLQEALRREPRIAEKTRIVAMEGSVNVGYNGSPVRAAEWNVHANVPAARAVFAASWDITFAPLDLCGTLTLSGDRYKRIAEAKSPRATVVMENYRDWKNRSQYAAGASSVLFDTAAVYLAMDDALCDMETIRLSIDDAGKTVPDEKGRPVRCGLRWKDRGAFEDLLVNALVSKR